MKRVTVVFMGKLLPSILVVMLSLTGLLLIPGENSSIEGDVAQATSDVDLDINSFLPFNDRPPTRSIQFENDQNIADVTIGSFVGNNIEDKVGHALDIVDDVNGDGIGDLVIGVKNNDDSGDNAGKVFLYFGKSSGWSMDDNLSNPDASFIGELGGDHAGASVAGVGDVNGDGLNDFVIGATGNDEGGSSAGQVYLILGKRTGWSIDHKLSDVDASFLGEGSSDYAGGTVAGAGDVNGDGYDDILIGATMSSDTFNLAGKTHLILGKPDGWTMDMDLSNSDASYLGNIDISFIGREISGGGDVNGDGYDDFLMGTGENGVSGGKVYLVLGKINGWERNISVSDIDNYFVGETTGDFLSKVSIAGDVNGDDIDDMVLGAPGRDQNGERKGKVYIIFGKASGWGQDTSVGIADASYIGDRENDGLASKISSADLNFDMYKDLVLGAAFNDEGGSAAGQVYIILGKPTGWSTDINITNADASFIGESAGDKFGYEISRGGDFTGDFRDDLLIGSIENSEIAYEAGQVYLLEGNRNYEPISVDSVEVYSNPIYSEMIDIADPGQEVFIELIGEDGNLSSLDVALLNITSTISMPTPKLFPLFETGINTGIYRNSFRIPIITNYWETLNFSSRKDPTKFDMIYIEKPFRPLTVDTLKICSDPECTTEMENAEIDDTIYFEVTGQDSNPISKNYAFVNLTSDKTMLIPRITLLKETGINTGIYRGEFTVTDSMVYIENLTVCPVKNPSLSSSVRICPMVLIGPAVPVIDAYEDEGYSVQYSNLGFTETYYWDFYTNKDWITFDTEAMILSGIPDNGDVGETEIILNLTDDFNHYSLQKFKITVKNLDPILTGENVLTATQDQPYYNDYDCTDEGVGNTTYHIWTSAQWLTMNETTGELSGTPTNDDVGRVLVGVSVHDGNGGVDNTQFNLTVIDVNDQCYIDTEPITTVYQDEPYRRTYTAIDLDPVDMFTWALVTDAEWLSMDQDTGVLEGTPTNDDVGTYTVNITVMDSGGLTDSTEFQLEVLNVNDRPEWIDVPDDMTITHGEFFQFNASATDIDNGTVLTYSIRSDPASEIAIDSETGGIEWHATIHIFEGLSKTMEVTIGVFDGGLYNNYTFVIEVLPSRAPSVTLLSPSDGNKISSTMGVLTWEGSDPEGDELIYSLYLSKEEPLVSTLQETAMIKTDFNRTSFTPGILEVGETYYWTVIPNDGCSDGRCSNDVFSFEVNAPPKVSDIDPQKASSGSKFSFYVRATDADDTSHTFSLDEAPEGMTIDDLGKIEWTPKDDQVGEHIVIVNVSDGVDYVLVSFKLTVAEGEEESSSLLPIILLVGIALIIVGVVLFFMISKKKEEETADEDEEHELTKEETYEAMYGEPAPKEEEGMTTGELKGFIHEQIEELEENKGEE